MRKMFFISLLVVIFVLLAACGVSSTPQVNIKVETTPNQPMMGDIELVFTITDAGGNPIEGATVDVSADHPDMAHGGMSGPAADQGGGRYAIKANFSMGGNWKITVYVRKGKLDAKQEIPLVVK